MKLHAIKARLQRILCSRCEVLHDAGDFNHRQFTRHDIINRAKVGVILTVDCNG